MSDTPRDPPTAVQRRLLGHFADCVMTQIQSRTRQYVGEQLRASEARLHRSEVHLSRAQRLADVGSAEIDLVTGEQYCSEEMYRIFGLPADAPLPSIDEMVRTLVHPGDRERVAENHRRLKRGEPAPQCEYRIFRPDGAERTVLRFGEFMFDAGGKPRRFMMAIQDVTELRRAEKARDEYREQLHHAQRLDALGTLAGGIAHDLNNTLVPILALTKLMRAGAITDDERRNLEVIQHAGERARDLVRQVLAFSRKAPVEHHRIELDAAVADTLRLMRASIDQRIRVTERLTQGVTVFADPGQIHQLVVNLVTNAAQAIGDHAGTISVTLDPGPDDASVRLIVADDGDGMDERTLSRMFEPFFTTRGVRRRRRPRPRHRARHRHRTWRFDRRQEFSRQRYPHHHRSAVTRVQKRRRLGNRGGLTRIGSGLRGYDSGVGDRLYQLEQTAPRLRVRHPIIGPYQLQGFAAHHRIGLVWRRRRLVQAGHPFGDRSGHRGIDVVEKKRNRNIQYARKIEKPACADAVGAAFVFLHLLKGKANGVAEPFLAHSQQCPPQPHPRSDMNIDGAGLVRLTAPAPTVPLLVSH